MCSLILITVTNQGQKYQYDSAAGTEAAAKLNPAGYSLEKPVNYQATYNGDETSTHNGVTLEKNQEYTRENSRSCLTRSATTQLST